MQLSNQIMEILDVLIEIVYENVKQSFFESMKTIFRTKVKY